MPWSKVQERVTEDVRSGEVIEKIVMPANQFSEAAAGRNLDKVRDIRVFVRTTAEVTDPSTSSAQSRQLPPAQKKVMWADMDSDSDA